MKKAVVSLTGASGAMGSETVAALMQDPEISLRVLLRRSKRGIKAAKKLEKRYGGRIEVIWGDIRQEDDCIRLCRDAEYLLHLAGVIPPAADHNAELTLSVNADGTKNLIRAILETGNRAKLVFISTVAIYGNRNEKHLWGRVGDPLVTCAFDIYGQSKTIAEFAIMESGLEYWTILRQTAVLYDNILMNNISDGLMFHTPWNAPIEWVTAKDSGILLRKIIRSDLSGEAEGFWKRVYNIGGGASARQTGYETFDEGFRLIGGSIRDFFEPNWNLTRNFHCFWFDDSDELENRFHFRTQGCRDFWDWYISRHRIYRAGKIIPVKLLRKLAIERLLKNSNAPAYWAEHGDAARIQAYFGGREAYDALPRRWEDVQLLCESAGYEELRREGGHERLNHGYDESKQDSGLSLEDMKEAAAFRGGECVSESMAAGELYRPLEWKCHEGHTFSATPYTILKAGHWCPACCHTPLEWRMDRIAAHSPFHAQVWLDSHSRDERFVYTLKDGIAQMENGHE